MSNKVIPMVDFKAPETWPAHYSDWDRSTCAALAAWQEDGVGRSLAELSRMSGVNRATLSLCMGGRYSASPTEHLRAAWESVQALEERAAEVREVPFVPGAMYRMLGVAVRRARTYRNISVVCGAVGTGKTRAARELAKAMSSLHLIQAHSEMSAGALLDELGSVMATKVPAWASASAKMGAIIRALKGTSNVVLVDEAETLVPAHRRADGRRSLEALRRIRDLAEVGIVLVGTDAIDDVIGTGHFDQLRSRVGARSPMVRKIAREDSDAVVLAGLDGQGDAITPEVLEACWKVCQGSMRVLVEGLIPSLYRDWIGKGKPLSPSAVRVIARDVLRLGQEG
jgi:DNA transposition AAA+ family ATPase